MAKRKRRVRKASLAGTHLHVDERSGLYVWRRTDPLRPGKRIKRTTGTSHLLLAQRKAAEFQEEWDKARAGIPTFKGWKLPLKELAEEWMAFQEREGSASAPVLKAKRFRILRALEELRLNTPADLADVSGLHDRVMALHDAEWTKAYLREAWQDPLKQFSKWLAENGRYLERDPLANWRAIPKEGRGSKRPRRAVMPDEFARTLLAADALDRIHGRAHPSRIVFTVLLVTGPRASALLSRNVDHFLARDRRIDFGADQGNKRRGEGALDSATAAELERAVTGRQGGPLLLSPEGERLELTKLLDRYREAFGLGLVAELWPAGTPWDVNKAYEVTRTLLSGRTPRPSGRVPTDPKKLAGRREQAAKLLAFVESLRAAWTERMGGIDVHALRKTHRTWALAQGVDVTLVDKQLGHAARAGGADSMDLLRVVAGSETGRKHYLDMRSKLLEAGRSAEAVRRLLDEAVQRVGSLAGDAPEAATTTPREAAQAGPA